MKHLPTGILIDIVEAIDKHGPRAIIDLTVYHSARNPALDEILYLLPGIITMRQLAARVDFIIQAREDGIYLIDRRPDNQRNAPCNPTTNE